MAEPSPRLMAAVAVRAYAPNGLPVNDRMVPEQLVMWQQRGGFWGKVANYYVKKHEVQAPIYRSPFAAKPEGGPSTAETFYQGLSETAKQEVDKFKETGMRN